VPCRICIQRQIDIDPRFGAKPHEHAVFRDLRRETRDGRGESAALGFHGFGLTPRKGEPPAVEFRPIEHFGLFLSKTSLCALLFRASGVRTKGFRMTSTDYGFWRACSKVAWPSLFSGPSSDRVQARPRYRENLQGILVFLTNSISDQRGLIVRNYLFGLDKQTPRIGLFAQEQREKDFNCHQTARKLNLQFIKWVRHVFSFFNKGGAF
jgi:hypothetical protein